MKVTLTVARVYGTTDQYGAKPRMRPPEVPIEFEGFPDAASMARIDFGPVPSDIADAERGRRALGRSMLQNLFGGVGAGKTADENFRAALEEIGDEPLFEEFNWYATLAISRDIEVKDESLAPTGFAFIEDAFRVAEEAQAYAQEPLDVLSTLAATIVDFRVFEKLVLDDRVLLFAEGKQPAGVPEFSASAAGSVKRGDESLAQLATRLSVLKGIDPTAAARDTWLARTAHWQMLILLETDPWKRFLWSFVALEILIHKLFERFRKETVDRLRLAADAGVVENDLPLADIVWPQDRAPLAARFAIVATALFPSSASEDTSRFRELKDARDRLTHGSLREENELPVSLAVDLLAKYLAGALKHLLLGQPAESGGTP